MVIKLTKVTRNRACSVSLLTDLISEILRFIRSSDSRNMVVQVLSGVIFKGLWVKPY